jgi:hypothetical protein
MTCKTNQIFSRKDKNFFLSLRKVINFWTTIPIECLLGHEYL